MAKMVKKTTERTLLLRLIEQGFDKTAWHGPNLKSAIRRVSPELAAWRPRPGGHNIAEVVLHCAYWKYATRRRIRGDKRGSFPLKGSNWFATPAKLTAKLWREYIDLLAGEHRALCEAIAESPWSRLTDGPGGGPNKPADHVFGVACHDIYHAGQIQTIKALHKATAPQ